jgi:integrase/recombinase XerD
MRFNTEPRTLKSFCTVVGDVSMAKIRPGSVRNFLAGSGPVTDHRGRKHSAFRGRYRFTIARGYTTTSSLLNTVPEPEQAFVVL